MSPSCWDILSAISDAITAVAAAFAVIYAFSQWRRQHSTEIVSRSLEDAHAKVLEFFDRWELARLSGPRLKREQELQLMLSTEGQLQGNFDATKHLLNLRDEELEQIQSQFLILIDRVRLRWPDSPAANVGDQLREIFFQWRRAKNLLINYRESPLQDTDWTQELKDEINTAYQTVFILSANDEFSGKMKAVKESVRDTIRESLKIALVEGVPPLRQCTSTSSMLSSRPLTNR